MTKIGLLESVKELSFAVFYGSATGQAEAIAESIVQLSPSYDFKTQAFPLNDIRDVKELTQFSCPLVIVASTTGDGEPPENCDRFWRKLRRKAVPADALVGVQYAILGLGDTNYNQFCNCGKVVNKRFQELGAIPFHPPGWADDGVGLELVVEDWIEDLWTALEKLLRPDSVGVMAANKLKQDGGLQLPICPPESLLLEFDDALKLMPLDLEDPLQPYPLIDGLPITAWITKARCLTKPGAVKTALELTLKFESARFDFEPGDAISVVCPNSLLEVNRLIERLNLSEVADKVVILSVKQGVKGKIPVFVPPGVSIQQMLQYYFDIRTPPKKNFLRLLAEYTSDESEKNKLLELCSRQGASQFESTIRFPGLSLLDILLEYPSCNPPPQALIEHLPRLIPRAYSISSSPFQNKDSFTFAFNVITFTDENGRKYSRAGVCTGWLYELVRDMLIADEATNEIENLLNSKFENMSINGGGGDAQPSNRNVVIYRRKNHNFRLPEDTTAPIIMVGPGTGVAPFVGFAEHRNEQKKSKGATIGDLFLYFGCRHRASDFLYENQLTSLVQHETISKLYPSFSRDLDQDVKYVQHYVEKNKEEVVDTLFEKGGYLYVCGDAKNMAKNVREVVTRCVETVKGITEEEAKTMVTELTSSKRYLQDVWS